MTKIAIVTPGALPVPCVKGGAVETGIQQLIDMNEKYGKVKFVVFSIDDIDAIKKAKECKNTEFIFIKEPQYEKVLIGLRRGINRICRLVGIKYRVIIRKRYIKKVKKYLKNNRTDAILIKNTESYVEVLGKLDIPIFYQLHNDFLNENTYRAVQIVECCKKIIANSLYIGNRVKTISNMKNREVFINYNCNENEKFCIENIDNKRLKKFREKYSLENNGVNIIFVGRITQQKGIKELIEALCLLPETTNWKLMVVGSKWFSSDSSSAYERELLKISEKCKDRITFLGYLGHEDIPLAYNSANIAVVPSIWDEPAGRVALEAEAAGLPLIVSDAGGIAEYTNDECAITVKRGENFVQDLKNSILYLINHKEECVERGKRGKEIAAKFNVDRYYDEIITYIEENL